jgi:hypothetical protein
MLNTTVLAPIPMASDSSVASANPGLLTSSRHEYRKSCQIVVISDEFLFRPTALSTILFDLRTPIIKALLKSAVERSAHGPLGQAQSPGNGAWDCTWIGYVYAGDC